MPISSAVNNDVERMRENYGKMELCEKRNDFKTVCEPLTTTGFLPPGGGGDKQGHGRPAPT